MSCASEEELATVVLFCSPLALILRAFCQGGSGEGPVHRPQVGLPLRDAQEGRHPEQLQVGILPGSVSERSRSDRKGRLGHRGPRPVHVGPSDAPGGISRVVRVALQGEVGGGAGEGRRLSAGSSGAAGATCAASGAPAEALGAAARVAAAASCTHVSSRHSVPRCCVHSTSCHSQMWAVCCVVTREEATEADELLPIMLSFATLVIHGFGTSLLPIR